MIQTCYKIKFSSKTIKYLASPNNSTYRNNNTRMKHIILTIASLLLLTHAIELAVSSTDYRCMVVYSTTEEEHLKIDMKFPRFTTQAEGDYYSIILQNTQTQLEQEFTIVEGTFRKEIQLAENVVYKLCMKIELNRQGKAEVQQYIEYKTSIKHASNVQDTRITVPATLLKIKDLSDSYTELVHIEKQLTDLNHSTKATAQTEESLFELQNQKIKKIETISFIELGLILVIGGFQFYRLRGIIYKREN